jgi:serine/threonine protein kinase
MALYGLKSSGCRPCRVEDYEEGGLFPCNSCGTLEYLAPEALGDTRHVNSSVDVYAFGILMWELLTGCPPYMLLSHKDILEEVGAACLPPGTSTLLSSGSCTSSSECQLCKYPWAPC